MLKEKFNNDLITAMKEKDKVKLNTLRSVKGAIQLEVINNKKEDNDELLLSVINKQIKMRNDSIEEFKKGSRDDLVKAYEEEIAILKEYMPEMLSSEEIDKIIDDAIASTGASDVKQMGLVMKEITPKIKNRCDMKDVSNKIREKLS